MKENVGFSSLSGSILPAAFSQPPAFLPLAPLLSSRSLLWLVNFVFKVRVGVRLHCWLPFPEKNKTNCFLQPLFCQCLYLS